MVCDAPYPLDECSGCYIIIIPRCFDIIILSMELYKIYVIILHIVWAFDEMCFAF